MKNEIVHVKRAKQIQEKLLKLYSQVITDACVKIAVLEKCFEENLYLEPLKIYVQYQFTNDTYKICQHIFEKKYSRRHFIGWVLSLEFKGYLKKFILSSET